jgi:hypothetical protein
LEFLLDAASLKRLTNQRLRTQLVARALYYVARFQLMANCQYQYHGIRRHPAILGFPASILGLAAQQRMICKQIKGAEH